MQVVSSIKQLSEQLCLVGFHAELESDVVEMIPHDVTQMMIHLSEKGSHKFLGVSKGVNHGVHIHHGCAVGLEVILVLDQCSKLHLVKNGHFQSNRRRKEVINQDSPHVRTIVPQLGLEMEFWTDFWRLDATEAKRNSKKALQA